MKRRFFKLYIKELYICFVGVKLENNKELIYNNIVGTSIYQLIKIRL